LKGEGIGVFVGDDIDLEGWFVFGDIRIGKRFVSDLVEGVRGVGDEFSEEDFFVGVEGVDDESHQLLDVGIEGKMLCLFGLGHLDLLYLKGS